MLSGSDGSEVLSHARRNSSVHFEIRCCTLQSWQTQLPLTRRNLGSCDYPDFPARPADVLTRFPSTCADLERPRRYAAAYGGTQGNQGSLRCQPGHLPPMRLTRSGARHESFHPDRAVDNTMTDVDAIAGVFLRHGLSECAQSGLGRTRSTKSRVTARPSARAGDVIRNRPMSYR
jgi:hypothetical protein